MLSDPKLRRDYDDRRRQRRFTGAHGSRVEPLRTRPEPEPLVPDPAAEQVHEVRLPRSFQGYSPSFDTLFDRILSNFAEGGQSVARQPEMLSVVVTLTPDQALRGGHVRLNLPATVRCSDCQGRGGIGYYECWRCGGAGSITGDYPVMVSYPPGIPDSHIVKISLDRFGMQNAYLSVRFRISDLL